MAPATDVASLAIRVETLEVKQAQRDLAGLEKAGAGAEKSVQGLTNVAAKLAATLAGLGAASFIKESAMLAARYETLGVVMVQAGKNAGYGSDQMRKFEKDLRAQGIAAIEARQNLAKMSAAQMDLSKAGQLARAAQDLAVVGGINSSEAFSRMTQGIQSGEVEVLRTIGLNVSWEESYKRVAKELGKNANALTNHEKLQARANEVLLKSKEYNGIYEESMKTAGKQISSFSRYWQDMQVDLGNSELPAVTILVQEATKRIKEFTAYIQQDDTQKALAAIGNTAVLTFDTVAKLGQQIGPLFVSVLDGYNRLPDTIKEVGIVGVLIGGRYGKIAMASVALLSSVTSSFAKIRDAREAYGNTGLELFDRAELNKQAEYARSMEGIYARLANVRASIAAVDKASGGKAVPTGLKAEEARLVELLAGSSELKLMQTKENDIRAAQARIYGGASGVAAATPKTSLTDAQLNKIRTATSSITLELIKANDVTDEGAGKVAELQKKYDAYAKTLGKANPLVKQYGELIAYANDHNGNSPAEVYKATQEVEKHTRALQGEIDALGAVSDLYGSDYSDRLTFIRAETAAQEQYNEAIKKGVSAQTAAAEKATELAKARSDIDARKQQAGKSTAAGFSGPAYDAQVYELKAQYEAAKGYTTDRVALEADLQSKLDQMDATRLRKSNNATDGMKAGLLEYSNSVGTAADRMANLWGTSFKSMEDALSNFAGNGETDIQSLFKTIRTEVARTQVVQPFLQSLSGGSLFSSIGSWFGFNHGGGMVGNPTFYGQVSPLAFAGAQRFHGGGWPGLASDEVPIIAQRGERVLSKEEVAAGVGSSRGGSPVQVIIQSYTGAQVQTKETTGAGGQRQLQVVIGEVVKGAFDSGQMDNTMSKNYGLRRKGY